MCRAWMSTWFAGLLAAILLCVSSVSLALPFNITPVQPLPTTVPAGGSVMAYYTVQNATSTQRQSNYVQYLPPHTTQVAGGGFCGTTFTLAALNSAGDSCVLALQVTGPISASDPDSSHHLFVCFPGGTSCAVTNLPLNVTTSSVSLVSITISSASGPSPTIPGGNTLQFTAQGTYSDSSVHNITTMVNWTSSSPSTATIQSTGAANPGLANGVAAGTTNIQANLNSVSSNQIPLTVSAATLVSIAISPSTLTTIGLGGTQQYTAIGTYTSGPTMNITNSVLWNSSVPSIAHISTTGLATAGQTTGTTTITATQGSITSNNPSLTVSSAPGVLTAVGVIGVAPFPAFLSASTDGGASWSVQPITNLPSDNSTLFSTSCTGTGSSTVCAAAGQDLTNNNALLVVSTNGGSSWSVQSIPGLPSDSAFNAISCTGSGSTAICTAAGYSSTDTPLLVQSTNGGMTWAVVNVSGIPDSAGVFSSTSCTGNSSTAICTVAGDDINGPLLAESTNGGMTWAVVSNISGIPGSGGAFISTSCTSSICTAAGHYSSDSPLLVQSTDGGITWAFVNASGIPASNVSFDSISCTGSGSNAICTVVGSTLTNAIVLAVTTNNGMSWSVPSTSGLLGSQFRSTSCTGSGSTAICIVAGESASGAPLLVQSNSGVSSWSTVSVTNSPASGTYFGTGAPAN